MESQKLPINYGLKEIILCSPFEKRSDRSWFSIGPGDFVASCYVEPDFNSRILELKKEICDSSDARKLDSLHEELTEIRKKETAKVNFENSLDSLSSNLIYIRGFSGTGKTTYINALFYKKYHNFDNVKCEIFDLNQSANEIVFLSYKWRNEKFVNTLYKFVSILMKALGEFLECKMGEKKDEHKKRMKLILDNYHKFFFENLSVQTNIFSIIEEYLNEEDPLPYHAKSSKNDEKNSFCFRMYEEIVSYCSGDDTNIGKTIDELLELVVVIFTCSHVTENISHKEFKTFLFFDNIENFINGDQVYNEHINEISKIFYEFINSMTIKFERVGDYGLRFSQHFKFILAIRDTTEKMIDKENLHHKDRSPLVQLNVSTWFSLDEIAERKIDYFINRKKEDIPNSSVTTESINTLLAILKDTTRHNSGLMDIISMMYNHNKWRIISYLLEALDEHPGCTKDYYCLWNIALDYEKKREKLLADTYKNAARQIILRILLDLIEKCEYFEKIRTLDGLGLARKILTRLHRHFPINTMEDETDDLGYVDFHTLLNPILSSPAKKGTTDKSDIINDITKILWNMNSSSRDDTKWCQLVDIKFNQHKFNEGELSAKLLKCFQSDKNEGKEQYAIKITDAGRYFIEGIIPIFEYFACRYKNDSSPLFSSFNLKLIERNFKHPTNQAIEHMKFMRKKVFDRIDCVTTQDINFFKARESEGFGSMYSFDDVQRMYCYASPTRNRSPSRNEQCHPLRILHSHIGYFDNYRAFILTIDAKSGYSDDLADYNVDIKRGLSLSILNIIESYVDKLRKLIDNEIDGDNKKIEGYPYVGKMNIENETNMYKAYIEKLKKAIQFPEDYSIRITTN